MTKFTESQQLALQYLQNMSPAYVSPTEVGHLPVLHEAGQCRAGCPEWSWALRSGHQV